VPFSVLINGSTSPFFRPKRALRQGCPFSPLSFLIIVEGLSRDIMEAKRIDLFKGIKVGEGFYFSHLFLWMRFPSSMMGQEGM
jgi:hypothetical protein